VLVLGGSQFMGRLTVEALLRDGHQVVMFNRGKTVNPFKGHGNLTAVKCDRMSERSDFREVVRDAGPSDVVIDFIGFQEAYMQDTVDALTVHPLEAGGRKRFATKHYIFISTDSVYWAQKVPVTDARLSEDDAQTFSPQEFEGHQEHCQRTSLGEYQLRYGGNKLGCERLLEEAWETDGFPFTALRLPDVYGPCDNLGGFWDLVTAIEGNRPIPAHLARGRIRGDGIQEPGGARGRCFSWAFAEDARDAILACMAKGAEVYGAVMHIAHEEAVSLHDTAKLIAQAMNASPEGVRFDDNREAALPSTDYGVLDVSRALRMLRPWRPTPMRSAVAKSVKWFMSSRENRRYHRLVHREPRHYDESAARPFRSKVVEVPSCWAGAEGKAALLREGPAVLNDALPDFTGQAVLAFMKRLMDQAGETEVACQLQTGPEVERQTWPLRHLAGHLLPQSEHSAAYHLDTTEVLRQTDIIGELTSPVGDICADDLDKPPRRSLHLGGVGGRTVLQRVAEDREGFAGFWDCVLLGRRKWRLFPPQTPRADLCAGAGSGESPADCFVAGPDAAAVQARFAGFSPAECWECEQTMGDAVLVPNGWWYQTYDDDRTLSISARFGDFRPDLAPAAQPTSRGRPDEKQGAAPAVQPLGRGRTAERQAGSGQAREESPEVIEFELVD